MRQITLAVAAALAVVILAACGGGGGDEPDAGETSPTDTAQTESSPEPTPAAIPVGGDPVLIQTKITDARQHTGKVLGSSFIGESAFCQGGTASGGSTGAQITTTLECEDGTLQLQFSPTQRSLVQGSAWTVLEGTGKYEGLRGGGSMVVRFSDDNPDVGGETFVGIIGK